jgi:hypothetical protein
MTNFDDFQDEYQASKAAAEAAAKTAEEAKEQAERVAAQAEREQQFKARAQRLFPLRQRIQDAVLKQAPDITVAIVTDNFSFLMDGVDMSGMLAFEPEYDPGYTRYSRKATNRVAIVVGSYGDRQRYPQRKDGNHKYEAIAEYLLGRLRRLRFEEQANAKRRANASAVSALCKEFDFREWGPVQASAAPEAPITVHLDRFLLKSLSMTPEAARTLLIALRAAGFKS